MKRIPLEASAVVLEQSIEGMNFPERTEKDLQVIIGWDSNVSDLVQGTWKALMREWILVNFAKRFAIVLD